MESLKDLAGIVEGAVFIENRVEGNHGLVVTLSEFGGFDLWTSRKDIFYSQRSFTDAVSFLRGEMG